MASPQKEDGFTPIANEIMDALCRTRIPGEERQVLDAILRKTYGWQKCQDAISLSQISQLTGLARSNVARALKSLLSKKIALAIKSDNTNVNVLKFNKNYDGWVLSKVIPVIRTDSRSVIKSVEKGAIRSDTHKRKNIQKKIKDTSNEFDTFYKAYPKKVGKKEVWRSWQRARDKPAVEVLLAAVEKQKQSDQWKRGYVPNPATWLNQGRWADEAMEGGGYGGRETGGNTRSSYRVTDGRDGGNGQGNSGGRVYREWTGKTEDPRPASGAKSVAEILAEAGVDNPFHEAGDDSPEHPRKGGDD